jgi:hypothetical protein
VTASLVEEKTVGGTEQVGGFVWLCGAEIEQLKFKVPVKPLLVTEKLPLALAPGVTVTGLLVNEKGGGETEMAGAFVELEGALLASPT